MCPARCNLATLFAPPPFPLVSMLLVPLLLSGIAHLLRRFF